jgi:hypothetical protein
MVYLLLVLAVALVIGPVMWLRPSQGQQRLARMRLRARQLGIDIRITELPRTRRAEVRREDVEQGALYRLYVHDPRTLRPLNYRCVRVQGGVWESSGDELPPALRDVVIAAQTQLPADAVAIELGAQGAGVFWRERGDESAVATVADQLQGLLAAMKVS